MSKKKSTTFYRSLLADAWRITWERKMLWIFGIFAALMSTGGVVDIAFRSFRRIEIGRDFYESVLQGTFIGFDLFGNYVQQLKFLETGRVATTILVITLIAISFVVVAVISQAALVIGAGGRKKLKFEQITRKGSGHFWQILALNLLSKAASLILVALTTLPLILFITRATLYDALLYFVLFLIFFPAIIIVSIISVLALIDIVRKDSHVFDAIESAVRLFSKNWLVTFELGVILFLTVFLAGLAAVSAIILLAIPYTILLILAIYSAMPFIFIIVHVIGFLAACFIFLSYAGAAVTFQYSAWLLFYDRALKKMSARSIIAKIERLLAFS